MFSAVALTHIDSFGGNNAAYRRHSNRKECIDERSVQLPTHNTDDGVHSKDYAPPVGAAISCFFPYLWMTRDSKPSAQIQALPSSSCPTLKTLPYTTDLILPSIQPFTKHHAHLHSPYRRNSFVQKLRDRRRGRLFCAGALPNGPKTCRRKFWYKTVRKILRAELEIWINNKPVGV